MFQDIIQECRALIEKKKPKKEIDERPEVSVSQDSLPPGHGTPYSSPARIAYTGGSGGHGQNSHT